VSVRLAVFASGGGSNLQAVIERFRDEGHVNLGLAISDRAESGALLRATAAGIAALHIGHARREPGEISRDMLDALESHHNDRSPLDGFQRLRPAEVIDGYRGHLLNSAPTLLPSFRGPSR